MLFVLTQMAALIACGVGWRLLQPMGIDADSCRRALTALVYMLLLPALVLDVLWQAPLGLDSLRISLSAASGVISCMLLAWLTYRYLIHSPATTSGALILASSFPNATYMGLPMLEQLLGPELRSVAIQYDLFACTPLVLTLGVALAAAHGGQETKHNPLRDLLRVPPLWAAIIGVALNVADVAQPLWLDQWLGQMGATVVPLMLISLGMSLQWHSWQRNTLPLLLPVIILQLAIMPLIVTLIAQGSGMTGINLTAVILEAALPSMVLGLVFCDRFGLNTGLYAVAVSVTTALSLFTIPVWLNWAS